jgi:Protein of unknown function (DUF1553)/Protein of unknown function (DUF1549)
MTVWRVYNGRGSARVQFQISPKNKREKRLYSLPPMRVSLFSLYLFTFVCLGIVVGRAEGASGLTFVNDVAPILTKASCNTGACHAKAGNGQNGFRLSLFGFEPQEDFEHIVKEGRGRRVFPAAPEHSLLLRKATNATPHGGGRKMSPDSEDYRTILAWIGQGMPYSEESTPHVTALEVLPKRGTLAMHSEQQLKVVAHFSDGSSRDVTRHAVFEPNDKNLAEVDDIGLVKVSDIPGNAAVMVRYQGTVATYCASVPLGAVVSAVPNPQSFVDELVFANLKTLGIPPSALCDDATYLRRVSVDVAGHQPTVAETRAFLSDPASDKRAKLVESLLASGGYADYFANKWAALLRNKRLEKGTPASFAFHAWLRDGFLANKPYDRVVRELLAATGEAVSNPPVAWYNQVKTPEQQLEDVAQLFLGVRMNCAQCHHHPFERWSQKDYYGLSAFFSQIGRRPTPVAGQSIVFHKRGMAQVENKKTKGLVKPAGLGGESMEIAPDDDPRLNLADWMSEKSNPFFAKSLVNRYWKHFFSRGLVEPEDDIRDTNPPSNPELLEALARHFTESGFDLKAVVRIIVNSAAYQLSATPNALNASDRQNFSHFYPKRLNAEVLLDAVDQLTGTTTDFADLPAGTRAIALPDNSYNKASYFLTVFGRPEADSACECERVQSSSLSQSLYLMNATEVKTKLAKSDGRAAKLSKGGDDAANIDELYEAALCRLPRAAERQIAMEFLASPRADAAGVALVPAKARTAAYEDLIWAVLNTKEFLYNH